MGWLLFEFANRSSLLALDAVALMFSNFTDKATKMGHKQSSEPFNNK